MGMMVLLMLRMMMARWYASCLTGEWNAAEGYANVRQPAGRRRARRAARRAAGSAARRTARAATGRAKIAGGEVRILAPLGSHVFGLAPPSPSGGRARGLLASLAHRGALLVLLLLTAILRTRDTRRSASLRTLDAL